ncbi:26S proteasome regulatory subunit p27 [Plasmodium gonderi]|uniref:26S proteasome regulatory subunit p27 n=1 Tax=Plasmodium gonderi TaxID=77519 RepID=A0A1Y1JH31_PLAGO|nr:26S proteasome regulatory subunit p27 [Plasmodium gonderi]GAW80645.1 26S proteasome regulatory subunit p27 [Plasmodium gonderi]
MNLEEFNQLVKKREEIECEIKANMDFLESPENKNVGMYEKLIDREGFPRNDIDIYAIRVARNKIICLKNDYLDINKRIEEYLHQVHSSHPVISVKRNKDKNSEGDDDDDKRNGTCHERQTDDNDVSSPGYQERIDEAKRNTFAMIDEMIENSPSHKAGLRVNDYIIQFGDIEKKENDNLDIFKRISDYMSNNPNKIEVKILREEKILFYFIYPSRTDKGLYIGCHLTPTPAGA